jgi:hypothetical protein
MYVPFEMRNPGPRPVPRPRRSWIVTGCLIVALYLLFVIDMTRKLGDLLSYLTMPL